MLKVILWTKMQTVPPSSLWQIIWVTWVWAAGGGAAPQDKVSVRWNEGSRYPTNSNTILFYTPILVELQYHYSGCYWPEQWLITTDGHTWGHRIIFITSIMTAVSNLYWHHFVNIMAIAYNRKGHHSVEASLLPHSHTPGSQQVGLVEFPDIAHIAKIQRYGGKTLHTYLGCNLFGQVLTASVLALIWWFSWLFLMLKIFIRSVLELWNRKVKKSGKIGKKMDKIGKKRKKTDLISY